MYIPDELIMGIHESTRALVIYRNGDGSFKNGFVMREGEFVASIESFAECYSAAFPKSSEFLSDDEYIGNAL